MGMGLRFEKGRHCDNGICAVGRDFLEGESVGINCLNVF